MRTLLSLLLACGVMILLPAPASAEDCSSGQGQDVSLGPSSVVGTAHEWASGCGDDGGGDDGPRDSGLDSICVSTAISNGEDPFDFCDIPRDDPPVLTPGLIAKAMKRIAIPPAAISVQPPNGRTLVNFDTNFFTTTTTFDPPALQLLGHNVAIHLEPARYVWSFGDGQSTTTTGPGAAYPDLQITHAYLNKGAVSAQVDVVWRGTFSVDGGPVQAIPGSATIAGTPAQLEVVTATPTLVGYQ